ncbi:MAG: hypothetical protein ACYC8T_26370, partial [Myxococcaceae bacterium]
MGALLPVQVDAGAAVWPWMIADHPSGLVAVVALAAAAPLLVVLSSLRLADPFRGALALVSLFAVSAALLADAEARSSLLPYVPVAWGRGGPLYLVALCLAGAAAGMRVAALRSRTRAGAANRIAGAGDGLQGTLPAGGVAGAEDGLPRTLALAALGCVALLYLWPHRNGSLAGTVVSALLASSRSPAFVMNSLLGLVPAFSVGVAAWAALRRKAPRSSNAAWMIAFTPAVLLSLSLNAGLTFRVDALLPVGLRAAALWVAAPLAGVAGLRALLEDLPGRRRLLFLLGAGCLLSTALTGLALAPGTPKARQWELQPEQPWALELYERQLIDLVFAVSRSTGPRDPGELDRAVAQAVSKASPVPALALAIDELGVLVRDVPSNRRAIERQGDRLNEAARAAGLPFYADVNVMGFPDGRRVRWVFYVKTYRISRVRTARVGEASYGVLWLERLDDTNVVERLLGWKKRALPYASVILDKLSGLWRDELLPALAFAGSPDNPYANVADELREDFEAELGERGRALLAEAVDCVQEKGLELGCEAELEAIEPEVVQLLARVVESHELQHVIDEGRAEAPPSLKERMTRYGDDSVEAATDELSAYLAEMGRSAQPRLALGHLKAVSRQPGSSESFAGVVLLEALLQPGEEVHQLSKLPREALGERAR